MSVNQKLICVIRIVDCYNDIILCSTLSISVKSEAIASKPRISINTLKKYLYFLVNIYSLDRKHNSQCKGDKSYRNLIPYLTYYEVNVDVDFIKL